MRTATQKGHTMPDGHADSTALANDTFMVNDRTVACDGGDGPLGHPRVFLRIVDHQVMCPYCSRLYVLNTGAGHDSGH